MNLEQLVESIVISGVATTAATQVLKSSLVFIPFQKSPRLTAFGVSVLAAAYAMYRAGSFNLARNTWDEWLAVIFGTFVVSAFTYEKVYKEPAPTVVVQQNVSPEVSATQNIQPIAPAEVQPR